MKFYKFFSLLPFLLICGIAASAQNKETTSLKDIKSLSFLGQYVVPYNFPYRNTTVGGLSGIDYNPADSNYYMICDDRSAINPARFYSARIYFTQKGIDSVQFNGVHSLLQPNGEVYPNSKQDRFHTPDPEAMRYDAATGNFIWSSEGERIVKEKDTVLENPAITVVTPGGKYIDTFPLPKNLLMQAVQEGPRQNSVLEGLTFADNYKTLFVSVEEPLYEDGPGSDVDKSGTTRIMQFDMATKKNIAQYAYRLEPVAHPSFPPSGFKINGIPDILSVGKNKLLVIERSFSTGRFACTIKVFLVDLAKATNVKNIASLQKNKKFIPASKKLLLNMDSLGIYIDNIEGVTFGPLLPNGHRTLLFVADNNFNAIEKMQFMLFEINE